MVSVNRTHASRGLTTASIAAIVAIAVVVALIALLAWSPPSAAGATAERGFDTVPASGPTERLIYSLDALEDVEPADLFKQIQTLAGQANTAYFNQNPCGAVESIDAIIAKSGKLEPESARRLVFAAAWMARSEILAQVSGRSKCADPSVGREAKVKLRRSDNRRLSAHVKLGAPELAPLLEGGRRFTGLSLPGLNEDVDALGRPALPVLRELIAIPRGARPHIKADLSDPQRLPMIPVPVQPETPMGPIDEYHGDQPPPPELFADPKFVFKRKPYRGDDRYPSGPTCKVDPLGLFREVRIGVVECNVARYLPKPDKAIVFGAIDFRITFEGGSGDFAPRRGGDPFQGKGTIQKTAPINVGAINDHLGPADLSNTFCTGEELMIITHADLVGPANEMATWKNNIGIPTHVFTVNDGAGPKPDSVAEIRELIRKRYKNCSISPSYVMLFGDAEYVPTDYRQRPGNPDENYIPTDWTYTQLAAAPGFVGPVPLGWQFAVGRIPVDPPQAEAVVDKLIGYEQSPPISPFDEFYGHAGIASQFDCCNSETDPDTGDPVAPDGTDHGWFIGTVEELRDGLMDNGYSVDRIYQKSVSGAYTGDPAPLYYNNGASLPPDLLPPFAWPGSSTGVVNAFNDGRSIMIHLDHGWSGGWSTPGFNKDQAAALTNEGELAFVLSYNCSSGYFDNETDGPPNDPNADSDPTGGTFKNWAEEIIRNPNGGAMGTIAATRTTYGHGNIMMKGALDTAFPNIDPDWGGGSANRRIGDMLNQARLYMADQYGAGDTTRLHWYLYNLHGDPTAELWTKVPLEIRIPKLVEIRPKFLWVEMPDQDGTILTAWQDTRAGRRPIGRAVVHDGVAKIAYFQRLLDGPNVQISADGNNAISGVVAQVASS